MMWNRMEIADMVVIGRATCQRINRLVCGSGAVAAARAAAAITVALDAHPEVRAAIVARWDAAQAARAARETPAGVARALAGQD